MTWGSAIGLIGTTLVFGGLVLLALNNKWRRDYKELEERYRILLNTKEYWRKKAEDEDKTKGHDTKTIK